MSTPSPHASSVLASTVNPTAPAAPAVAAPAAPKPRASWMPPGWAVSLLTQVLTVAVAVISVFLAAQEGLRQAIQYDQYTTAQRLATAVHTLKSELEINVRTFEKNLQSVRFLILCYARSSVKSAMETIDERELALQEAEEVLAKAADEDRNSASNDVANARGRLDQAREWLSKEQQVQADYEARVPAALRSAAPQFALSLDMASRSMWENISQQGFLFQLDADVVTLVVSLYDDAQRLAKPQNAEERRLWSEFEPTRISSQAAAEDREAFFVRWLERAKRALEGLEVTERANRAIVARYQN